MTQQLPCRLCADVADAVFSATTPEDVLRAFSATLSVAVPSESSFFMKSPAGWSVTPPRRETTRDFTLRRSLDSMSGDAPRVALVDGLNGAPATVIAIDDVHPLVFVIDEDWSPSAEVLDTCARVLTAALRAVRGRRVERDARRLLRRGYRLANTAVAQADIDVLCKKIVNEVASMFAAGRVSLAVFDASDEMLRIRASVGLPVAATTEVSTKSADSVMANVFAQKRALTVDDARSVPSMQSRRNYLTSSFAAVPLIHAGRCLGVLSVTDKRGQATFDGAERVSLTGVAALTASALASADAKREIERLEYAASVDALTGLLNRGYFDDRLRQEVARSQREGGDLAVLIADIDDFKTYNDSGGHIAGDVILKDVGEIMRSAVRVFDVCARYGGDEFAVVMPNADRASALSCAERIRVRMANYLGQTATGRSPITMSIGVAVAQPFDDPATLVARADRAMYEAKKSSKNTIRVADDPPTESYLPLSPDADPEMVAMGVGKKLPYILVADPDRARQDIYRALAERYRLGLIVARDGTEAIRVVKQFGAPTALCVDMAASSMRAVSIIESIHDRRPEITVALNASRDLRHYARLSSDALQLTTLRAPISTVALTNVLETALRRIKHVEGDEPAAHPTDAVAAEAPAVAEDTVDAAPARKRTVAAFDGVDRRQSDVVTERRKEVAPVPVADSASRRRTVADDDDAEGLDWEPTLLERQRGEFEVARELARTRREQRQMSVVLFDLAVANARRGASPNEDVSYEQLVQRVTQTFVRSVRQSDLPIRWHNNELLLILPGATGTAARAVAERVRAAMQVGGDHHVAISGGVAELAPTEPFAAVMRRARDRVTEALGRGHNRVS
jgi:diguanylate cyclase (GGDEF)-like protein